MVRSTIVGSTWSSKLHKMPRFRRGGCLAARVAQDVRQLPRREADVHVGDDGVQGRGREVDRSRRPRWRGGIALHDADAAGATPDAPGDREVPCQADRPAAELGVGEDTGLRRVVADVAVAKPVTVFINRPWY